MTDEISYKKYLLKKELQFLKEKKGYHTELITLMIPPSRKISDVTNYLKNEVNESSNIKSKLTRNNVIDSITALLQKLKNIKEIPPNGIIMYSGAIPQGNSPGTEKIELYIVEPIEPITNFRYSCSSEFDLSPLENMLKDKQTYGIVVIDANDVVIAWVRGNHVEIAKTDESGIMGKHDAGGQSARRFERLHEEHLQFFLAEASELANEVFVPMVEAGNLEGIFVGGAGHTKYKFVEKGKLDYRIKNKVIEFYDIGVGGEEGVRAVLMKAEDKIANVQYVKEKKLMQKFLYELSRDTGLYAYGEKEVRESLVKGAVQILLLSEDLKMKRVTIKCDQCGNIDYKTVKDADLPKFQDQIKSASCTKCNTTSLYKIAEIKDIIEDLGEIAETQGTEIEMISRETEEGETLMKTFGGICAILRYKIKY